MRASYMRQFFVAVAAVPLLITSACDGDNSKADNADETAISVQVLQVKPTNLIREINAVGTIKHRRETPLGFTTSGKVASMRYDVGDHVKKGALIAALDTTNVSADLNVARAEQDRAESEFGRIASLYKDGWVTKGQYESAQATLKAAAARVQQAGFASGTSRLYAPSSGVILARNVEAGQVVSAGQVALILGQGNEGFVFRAPIIDSDAAKLRVGMPATLSIEALDSGPIETVISEIDGRANETTGAFTVQFRIKPRAGIRSGQIGSAKIALPAAEDGSIQIPARALFAVRTSEGLVYVLDKEKQRVEIRNVAIKSLNDDFVVVSGGIEPGDIIVTSGIKKLRPGAKVNAVSGAG